MGLWMGCMKTISRASSLGFADACLCGKAGLVSLESKCSELSELSGSSGLRDHAGTPDHHSWVQLKGTAAPSTTEGLNKMMGKAAACTIRGGTSLWQFSVYQL